MLQKLLIAASTYKIWLACGAVAGVLLLGGVVRAKLKTSSYNRSIKTNSNRFMKCLKTFRQGEKYENRVSRCYSKHIDKLR